jgi:hypothetical protein
MKKFNAFLDWILENKAKALLSLGLFMLLLVIGGFLVGLAIKYIIIPILTVLTVIMIFLLLAWLNGDIKFPASSQQQPDPLPPLVNIYGTLTAWAHEAVVELCSKNALPSPVRMPTGVGEVCGSPQIVTVGGFQRLQFFIPLQMNNQDMPLDLADVKAVLQAGFNSLISEGNLPDQPFMSGVDGMPVPVVGFSGVSLVHIADIRRERLRLVVTAFWVNNNRAAFCVKLFHKKQPRGGAGDVDTTDQNY